MKILFMKDLVILKIGLSASFLAWWDLTKALLSKDDPYMITSCSYDKWPGIYIGEKLKE